MINGNISEAGDQTKNQKNDKIRSKTLVDEQESDA